MRRTATALALLLSAAGVAPGQRPTPPKKDAAPTGPRLNSPATAGLRPGALTEFTWPTENAKAVTAVWTPVPGTATITASKPNEVRVSWRVPATAPPGVYPLRLVTDAGLTNARPICVDPLAPVEIPDAAKSPAAAFAVPVGCVATGCVEADGGQFVRFKATAGVPVTLDVLAKRLGSALDPVLIVSDALGRAIPGAYADDTPGLQTDARVTWTPKATGDYLAEVRDSTYRGGPEFGYRLRVHAGPVAVAALPAALERGQMTPVEFVGPGELAGQTVRVPDDGWRADLALVPRFPPDGRPPLTGLLRPVNRLLRPAGWPVAVRIADTPQLVEVEPNDTAAQAQLLPVPGGVTGRFLTKNDRDYYRLAAKKGDKLSVAARTAEVGSPCEVLLTVTRADGSAVGKSDAQKPAARVEFAADRDGDYLVLAEHLNYLHGPGEIYLLEAQRVRPDFALTLADPRADVPPNGVALLNVTVARTNGDAGPISLSLIDPTGTYAGATTVPAGFVGVWPLAVRVEGKGEVGPRVVGVVGKSSAHDLARYADATESARVALGGLPVLPPGWANTIAAAPAAELPFTLTVAGDLPTEVVAGKPTPATLAVTRRPGFTGAVDLAVSPPFKLAKPVKVAPDAGEAAVEWLAPADAAAGPQPLTFSGSAAGRTAFVAPVAVVVKTAPAAKGKAKP